MAKFSVNQARVIINRDDYNFDDLPRPVKSGIVIMDPDTGVVKRVIGLQYNPDSLKRGFQIQGSNTDSGDHLEALRLKGPPVETISIEAELDAADQLEMSENKGQLIKTGLHEQLAALETMIYPGSDQVIQNHSMASSGTIEVIPLTAPLTVFVWSKNRVLPVRITEFSITEEAFNTNLNPIRAKVSIGMRVLSVNDVPINSKAGNLYMSYFKGKERFASKAKNPSLDSFGIVGGNL